MIPEVVVLSLFKVVYLVVTCKNSGPVLYKLEGVHLSLSHERIHNLVFGIITQ
jgi:hypothetical protein